MTSEAARRTAHLLEARRPDAIALAAELSDLVTEPEAFLAVLRPGLLALADEAYVAEQARVAPGLRDAIGVRWPLLHALEDALRPALRESSPDIVLWLAQRLAAEPEREIRLLALPCLRMALRTDPERSWQTLRRLAHGARDWIDTDTIAETYAQGVLAERFRWAELEQLVYSARPMERRLVGATLARIPHEVPRARRSSLDPAAALDLVGQLLGDPDDQVQKALSWALREWSRVDRVAVGAWLEEQSLHAAASADGHRAWVIRDALAGQPEAVADPIKERLAGIRRRSGAPSTSRAAGVAASFGLAALTDQAIAQQGERFMGRGA